jgi:hypothetical protein
MALEAPLSDVCSEEKPIDFAAAGLCLALSFNRNCRIRADDPNRTPWQFDRSQDLLLTRGLMQRGPGKKQPI